jgi:hypothetical protein
MTDSSVVPIDGGAGAREQSLSPEAAGDSNKQPRQSSLETPKAVNNAVDDPTAEERDALAERYFKNDLADQRRWYSAKAGLFKTRSELLALLTIVLGASITFIQVFGVAPWVRIVSGSIGAVVAIAAIGETVEITCRPILALPMPRLPESRGELPRPNEGRAIRKEMIARIGSWRKAFPIADRLDPDGFVWRRRCRTGR